VSKGWRVEGLKRFGPAPISTSCRNSSMPGTRSGAL
jgi:hypothetical protein